jgi:hypothetical protein
MRRDRHRLPGSPLPGSARLFELADVVLPLQVEVLCWCGRIGRFNGRVIDAHLVWDGATVVVADTVPNPAGSADDFPARPELLGARIRFPKPPEVGPKAVP